MHVLSDVLSIILYRIRCSPTQFSRALPKFGWAAVAGLRLMTARGGVRC